MIAAKKKTWPQEPAEQARHLVTLIIQASMCECSIKKKLPEPNRFSATVPPIIFALLLKSQELDHLRGIKRLVKKTPVPKCRKIKNAKYDAMIFPAGRKTKKRTRKVSFLCSLEEVKTKATQNPGSGAAAVHAATGVVSRVVVGAGGVVGVVVESSAANIGVVAVRKEFLHFPVVGTLTDGELEIFLSDGVPELNEY